MRKPALIPELKTAKLSFKRLAHKVIETTVEDVDDYLISMSNKGLQLMWIGHVLRPLVGSGEKRNTVNEAVEMFSCSVPTPHIILQLSHLPAAFGMSNNERSVSD